MNRRLIEVARGVTGIAPQNISGTATTSVWVALKNYRRLAIAIYQGAWAAGTPAVTLNQAKDSSGGSSKALAFDIMYQSTSSADIPVSTTVTNNTFNLPNQANTLSWIEIHCQDLDVANGFAYVQVAVASPGANADYLAVVMIPYDGDWGGKPDTMPAVTT